MQRQNIIVMLQENKEPVTRGNFKKLCLEFGLPYHTLARLKFPIQINDVVIHKTLFK